MENDIKWVIEARKYLGKKEIPGKDTSPFIEKWLIDLKAWWRDDETPWCGVAMGAWMKACGISPPREWYRAKSWLNWGNKISKPVYGAVVVFERQGGGHVGIILGLDLRSRLLVIGGNQSDAVTIAPFDTWRVAGYRWPSNQISCYRDYLPVYNSTDKSSTNEK